MEKKCNTCKITKDIEQFSKRNDRPNGRQPKCKQCCSDYRKAHLQYYKDYHIEYRKKNSNKINSYHSKYNSRRDNGLYSKWIGILKRINSEIDAYSYKERGIINEWKSYPDFKNDMYETYLIHLGDHGRVQTSLDRIDNNGNYCKENCRWATWIIQNNNKRPYRKGNNVLKSNI